LIDAPKIERRGTKTSWTHIFLSSSQWCKEMQKRSIVFVSFLTYPCFDNMVNKLLPPAKKMSFALTPCNFVLDYPLKKFIF
jgi:hypothetical protein